MEERGRMKGGMTRGARAERHACERARRVGARRWWSAPFLADRRPASCRPLSLPAAAPSSAKSGLPPADRVQTMDGGEQRGTRSGRRRRRRRPGGATGGKSCPCPLPPPSLESPPLSSAIPSNHGTGAARAPEPRTAQQQTKLRGLSRPALSVLAASARAALARPPFSGAQTTRHPQPTNQPSARLGPTRLPDLARPPKKACSQFKRQSDRPQTLFSVSFCYKEGAQTRAFASGARVKVDSRPPPLSLCTPTPPPSRFSLSRAPRRTEGQLIHSTSTQPP